MKTIKQIRADDVFPLPYMKNDVVTLKCRANSENNQTNIVYGIEK